MFLFTSACATTAPASSEHPFGTLRDQSTRQQAWLRERLDTALPLLMRKYTQHLGYVPREGETEVPAGLKAALARSNRLQDIVVGELRPGRTGNDILKASRERMKSEGIDGTVYSHPIGLNGHGAGPMIGLWDRQEGVPGNGDHTVIANEWFSIEWQATSPVPEWGGQRVRSAQEEDVIVDTNGKVRWAFQRQTAFHLVR